MTTGSDKEPYYRTSELMQDSYGQFIIAETSFYHLAEEEARVLIAQKEQNRSNHADSRL